LLLQLVQEDGMLWTN